MDMKKGYSIPMLPLGHDVEGKETLRLVHRGNCALAELKGIAATIPNKMLISPLPLQEAKDREIVTTPDDRYKAEIDVEKRLVTAATEGVSGIERPYGKALNWLARSAVDEW